METTLRLHSTRKYRCRSEFGRFWAGREIFSCNCHVQQFLFMFSLFFLGRCFDNWLNLSHPAFSICYHSKRKKCRLLKTWSIWLSLEGINLALPRKIRFHLGEVFTVHFIVKFRTCPLLPDLPRITALTGRLHRWAINCGIYSVDNTFQNTFFMSFWDENQ